MWDLTGRRVVVTGASSGLGAAMADALLGAGAIVAFASRPGERLERCVSQRQSQGLKAVSLPVDVRDATSVDSAANLAFEVLGGVDMVVNNAGIGMRTVNPDFLVRPSRFYETSVEGFKEVIATNLTGYFLVGRAFAPKMIQQGSGRFVNVSMNHETMKRRGFIPYGPSRAGAESLSLIMAEDLRSQSISVNMLLPGGATLTGMIPDGLSEEMGKTLLDPSVMADPIVFLASPEAEGLTAERIVAKDFPSWLEAYRSIRSNPTE